MTYYHGTSRHLAPGDYLLPGGQVGRDNYPGITPGHSRRVHVTTSLEIAVIFALAALSGDEDPEADVYVYQVEPEGQVLPDPGGPSEEDFVCVRAKVVREIDPDEVPAPTPQTYQNAARR